MRAIPDRQEYEWQRLRYRPRWQAWLSQFVRRWTWRLGL